MNLKRCCIRKTSPTSVQHSVVLYWVVQPRTLSLVHRELSWRLCAEGDRLRIKCARLTEHYPEVWKVDPGWIQVVLSLRWKRVMMGGVQSQVPVNF